MGKAAIWENDMKKKVIALFLAATCVMGGCGNLDLGLKEESSEDNTSDVSEVSNESDTSKDDAEDEAKESDIEASNEDEEDTKAVETDDTDEAMEDSIQVDYRVIYLYEEEVDSVPVSIVKTGAFDDGDVYSYDIVYDEDVIVDYHGDLDRLHIGTFLFKEDEIYLITDTRDNHKEQDFYDYGVLVYSEEDYSDERSGYKIKLHNDGYLCRCSYYDTISESGGTGYYAEYVFDSDKVLTYYRSGYGAEAEPIEITTNTYEDIENLLSKANESELTKEDVTITYNGFDIGPDTSYQEIINALSYPENFEDTNNGFISAQEGYRWQLSYPDALDYSSDYEVRIVCVSPSMEFEGSDTYMDFIYLGIPTRRDISEYDSIYSLIDAYGAPDDIREGSWSGYTDIVYEFEGHELTFTVAEDNTIVFIKIDFAG